MKAPIDVLGLSNGARSGLTGFVAGLARSKVAPTGVTINNLLPGLFDTDRIAVTFDAQAKAHNMSVDEARKQRIKTIPAGRFGTRKNSARLRVPMQRACGLHHRAELADRRRRLSRHVLNGQVLKHRHHHHHNNDNHNGFRSLTS